MYKRALTPEEPMASLRELYPIPDIDPCWTVPQDFEASFDWEYDDGRKQMVHLY